MAEETTTEPAVEEANDQLIKCPCCGELTLRKPLDIKSAVLDEYMASLISGIPFQHTYPIHNSIDITVSVLTKTERTKIYSALQLLDTLSKTIGETDPEARTKVDDLDAALQLYSYITEIQTRKDDRVVATFTPANQMNMLCDAILKEQPEILSYAIAQDAPGDVVEKTAGLYDIYCTEKSVSAIPDVMLRAIVRTHIDLHNILMNNGFDANFWKGIELV